MVACYGCGGEFPESDGPTHRYLGSSPGCWAVFGQVLAREYGDLRYHEVHRLTVDTYALQHPGQPSQQTIRSVALHGISLCAIFELKASFEEATRVIQQATRDRERFEWLTPPSSTGGLTVLHVARTTNLPDHKQAVRNWAASVWEAWSSHHTTFRRWLEESWDE